MVNEKRVFRQNNSELKKGAIVYWMQRDQRVEDNWALLYVQQVARENNQPIVVIFCLTDSFLGAPLRHYDFMISGLKEVERNLAGLNIPFILLTGKQEVVIPKYLKKINAGLLVMDFSPLKVVRKWKQQVLSMINITAVTVDAHNVVPCWFASDKEEFAAYTIRPKIKRMLPEFLEEFPRLSSQDNIKIDNEPVNWNEVLNRLKVDENVQPVSWLLPGESAANNMLKEFLNNRFANYSYNRNDPTKSAVSNLSPYLHFGQISAQRVALETLAIDKHQESKESFLEELIVRRELADNFCFYNNNYDSFEGIRDWAKDTLNAHKADKREYTYSRNDFESADTHDPLWNAAQTEMVVEGKMHGYLRMYWAKKILEWTNSPEEAFDIAVYLNDKYELDGRDPNGYTGIAWSIGGIHDRAWANRPVFGKIRYMNYNGCKRKFDVDKYISEQQVF